MVPNSSILKCSKSLWEDHTPARRDGKPVCSNGNRPQHFLFPPAFGMLQSSSAPRIHLTHTKGFIYHKDKRFRWRGARIGEMPERLKGLVLKTSEPKGSVGSNPTLSAIYLYSVNINKL